MKDLQTIALEQSPLTRENYFDFKEHEGKPVLHSSALRFIYPGEGGSAKKYERYLAGIKEEKKPHQTMGTIFHKYLQNAKAFEVEPATLPEESIVTMTKMVFERVTNPSANDELMASMPEGAWDKLKGMALDSAFPLLGTLIIDSAHAIDYYKGKRKDETIFNEVVEKGGNLWKSLCAGQGKHMLTGSQKEKFDGMKASLLSSPWAEQVLSRKALHEVPILWEHNGLWFKALLDWVLVDEKQGIVSLLDFKTTSKAIGNFYGSTELAIAPSGSMYVSSKLGSYYIYRYYRQIAFYKWGLSRALGLSEGGPGGAVTETIVTNVLAFETLPPYEVKLDNTPALGFGISEITDSILFLQSQRPVNAKPA